MNNFGQFQSLISASTPIFRANLQTHSTLNKGTKELTLQYIIDFNYLYLLSTSSSLFVTYTNTGYNHSEMYGRQLLQLCNKKQV